MDEGTLKALKTFTNLGYILGLCPYKFKIISPLHKITTDIDVEDFESEKEERKKSCGHFIQGKLHWIFSQCENIFHRSDFKISQSNWTFTQPSDGRWLILLLSISLHLSYQIFLICRFIQSILYREMINKKDKIEISYLAVVLLLHNTFIWLLVRDFRMHDIYLNSACTYLNHLVEKHKTLFPFVWNRNVNRGMTSRELRPRSIKIFFRAATIMVILAGFGRGLRVFKNPASVLFVTSLSKDPQKLPIWIKLCAAFFHFHVMAFTAFMSTFLGTTLAWYSSVMVFAAELTRISGENKETRCRRNKTLESLDTEKPEVAYFLQNTYYQLSALQNNFKSCYGTVPLGGELISVYVIVFNMYSAIIHHDLTGLLKALVMAYLLKVFLSKLAEIHTVSEQVIESWTRNRHKRNKITWFPKFLNSVQSLRIYVGSFFYVDKKLILTVISVIINLTTNLILFVK